jgi:putative transposase
VERNAVRAGLVGRAEHWQWSSLYRFLQEDGRPSEILSQWPMERPKDWADFVNASEREWSWMICGPARSEADRLVVKTG